MKPSIELAAKILAPFGVHLSDSQLESVVKYVEILLVWNQSINLTAIEDPAEILARHFGESMFAMSLIPLHFCRLADVGAGAGFPGMALKIAVPDLDVILIEPNKKRCAFLTEVKRAIGLSGVEIVRTPYEECNLEKNIDFVCSRALGDYRNLLRWSKTVLKPDGQEILWVGASDSSKITEIQGWAWDLPIRVPGSLARFIMKGRPLQ